MKQRSLIQWLKWAVGADLVPVKAYVPTTTPKTALKIETLDDRRLPSASPFGFHMEFGREPFAMRMSFFSSDSTTESSDSTDSTSPREAFCPFHHMPFGMGGGFFGGRPWLAETTGEDATHFDVKLLAEAYSGETAKIAVVALDESNQPVRDYTGTVQFSSSDPSADLPVDYTFTLADRGVHVFEITAANIGDLTITVTETTTQPTEPTDDATDEVIEDPIDEVSDPSDIVEEVIEEPTEEVIEEPTDELIEEPVADEIIDEVIEEPTDEFVDEVLEEETDDTLIEEPTDESLSEEIVIDVSDSTDIVDEVLEEEPADVISDEPTEDDVTDEPTDEVVTEEPTEEVVDDVVTEEPTDEVVEEVVTEETTVVIEDETPATGTITIDVEAAPVATHFAIRSLPSAFTDQATRFMVVALDPQNRPVTNYTGTIHLSSTDANATLPEDFTFTDADRGVHVFSAEFDTTGTQTITVSDTTDATRTGAIALNVRDMPTEMLDFMGMGNFGRRWFW